MGNTRSIQLMIESDLFLAQPDLITRAGSLVWLAKIMYAAIVKFLTLFLNTLCVLKLVIMRGWQLEAKRLCFVAMERARS
mmetsp:Transcript_59076/g.128248  ORF Transcript_59076/g.128248 Transcript_59076/m.128248 type:complete len:80 (-) Transcript_59076:800-1039(-)